MNNFKLVQVINTLQAVLKVNVSPNVFLNKQWFDFRELPSNAQLSLLILEEFPLEYKGLNYKQELTIHVEGFSEDTLTVYHLIFRIKQALLGANFFFSIKYHGFEITPPDEGGQIVRLQVKFKVIYLENIEGVMCG